MRYVELQVTSNFSFLRGASHPEELMEKAAQLGYEKLAITDRNTLAGIVRAHIVARKHAIKLIPACRLDLLDGPSLLAYPINKKGYAHLSALLSLGNSRAEKGECYLYQADVWAHKEAILFIAIAPMQLNTQFDFETSFKTQLQQYKAELGNSLYLAMSRTYTGLDQKRMFRLAQLGEQLGIPLAATNNVHYHEAQRRQLQDILTCVREKCTIYTAGYKLHANAERYLKPGEEMHRLFRPYPQAIENALYIAQQCQFSLDELKYVYPEELTSEGRTPQEELIHLTWLGAKQKFGENIPTKILNSINYELDFVARKNYASYFLTVHDFVRFARSRDILCQGRGSAANSVICFCLGITSVDPNKINLLFARFMSDARNEPPDIDVDFEHERREEVMQYIYEKYGRDRAAIVATVTQLRSKGAVRDVGKAMGLSNDMLNLLSATVSGHYDEGFDRERLVSYGINPDEPLLKKTLELTAQMVGFPRQLGQHTGGFIITQGKLSDLCPTLNARMENRTCIEWNKDDIEALGFLKVDVLALGMLTCVRKAFDLTNKHYGKDYALDNIPREVPKVYEMISKADTIGVFQIESRAQMSMLPRLKPNEFYDLVIEVAIVRPGPIQGDMVHPYLRRRNGLENIDYPSEELEDILKRTMGVPLFQEQAMEIAIVAAEFTPAEADELRRSMATFKAVGKVTDFKEKLINGMIKRGYKPEFAERIFRQIEGFGGYGFPESHAASFALLVYISSYLKCFYPEVFATALLNSMPMGFYQPAQIVIDAQKHGVTVLPVDINHSVWDNTLENKIGDFYAIRLGFRQVKGLSEEEMNLLVSHRQKAYQHLSSLRDIGIAQSTLEKLADADAFRSMEMDRRTALWQISALHDRPIALFKGKVPDNSEHEAQIALPFMPTSEHVVHDYAHVGLSLKAHPLSFVRQQLDLLHVVSTKASNEMKDGETLKIAGLILIRQRPGTASGICFITIEDETGTANLVVYQSLFEQYRKEILGSKLLMVEGRVQRDDKVVHIVVQRCHNYNGLLQQLHGPKTRNIPANMGEKAFHDGRNFK
jgi:error-prone DNA polymerase